MDKYFKFIEQKHKIYEFRLYLGFEIKIQYFLLIKIKTSSFHHFKAYECHVKYVKLYSLFPIKQYCSWDYKLHLNSNVTECQTVHK